MDISLSSFRRKLEKKEVLIVLAILLAGLALRIAYWSQIKESTSMYQHLWPQTDMNFFYTWANSIRGGDWLVNKSLHPFAEWQEQLSGKPDEKGYNADSAKAMWDQWYGEKRFHQEPLYPYFLAVVFKLFGPGVQWVFAIQCLLGIVSNLLIYVITRRFFGTATALIAAAISLLYGPFMFYESVLLRATLITFTMLLTAWLFTIAMDHKKPVYFLLSGLSSGICVVTKSTTFLFILPLVLFLIFHFRADMRQAARFIGLFALGIFLATSPFIVRNLIVGVAPLALSSVAADAIISGNAGDFIPGTGFSIGRYFVPIMEKAHGNIIPTIYYTLRTHSSVASVIKQLCGKFLVFWNWYEIPNNINYYYARLYSGLLSHWQITFAALGPVSFFGLFLAARTIKKTFILYALVFAGILPGLIFYNLSRFRAPAAAALIPFAAYALVFLIKRISERRYAIPVVVALISVFLLPLFFLSPPRSEYAVRAVDYRIGNALCISIGERLIEYGDLRGAAGQIEAGLRTEPPEVSKIGPGYTVTGDKDRLVRLAESFAKMHLLYAELNEKLSNNEKADDHYKRASELDSFVKNVH
ncbi:MAG: glycosyltransferase family 39 protein [Candidatus Omnitrophica bacterium]|nr:glycosyltransferase family 39 protein [Candidatus Omnitrophota bacterium]